MDDVTIDDLNNQQNSAGHLSNSASDYIESKYSLWLHTTNNLFTVYHGDGRLQDIGAQILSTTRLIKHCSVWCTPKVKHSEEGEVDKVNIMDEETVKNINHASSFFAQNLEFRFDLNENKRSDIAYMVKAITEAFMTFDRIVRLCMPDSYKARQESVIIQTIPCDNPNQWAEGWMESAQYFRLAYVGELKDNDFDRLLATLNVFSSKEFTIDDLVSYFDSVRKCSVSIFNEIVAHGADTRITQRVIISREVSDNSIEITIPKNVSTSLLKLNPESLAREYKVTGGVRINILGNLIIKDLEDFENVQYINSLLPQNQLTLKCTLTPRMLHYLLTHFSFNTIDVTHAKVWHNDCIVIDSSSKKLKNPDVKIIGNNPNIIVTEK